MMENSTKHFGFLILAAMLLVSACYKEQEAEVSAMPTGKGLVIMAENTPLSKVDIDHGSSVWEYGDSISVVYDGQVYIYKTVQTGNQVTFTCANGIADYDESRRIIAYYPAVSSDEVVSVHAEQEISFIGSDQINSAKAPLVGVADSEVLSDGVLRMSFHNICSVIEFRMDQGVISDRIKSLKVEPASETGFEGYLSFAGTVNPETLAIATQSTGNSITLNFSEDAILDRPLTLKIPVGRFKSPSGLKLTAEGANGSAVSRVVYTTGIESYTETSGIYSVKHFAKPLYPFVLTPPETVDLGLSVLWASCNLGATAPEEYGSYYAWGETGTKDMYNWGNYKFGASDTGPFSKYNTDETYGTVDGKTILEPDDDVANLKLGKNWRMPTEEELQELIDNCTWTTETINEISGRKVTSNKTGYTDRWIFLPAGGYMDESEVKSASAGYYWSSILKTDRPSHGRRLLFGNNDPLIGQAGRNYGMFVRPVYVDKSNIPVTSVSIVPSRILVEVGNSASLTASIRPADATDQLISWSSADPSIATVDQSGRVTGVGEGTTSIIATCGGRSFLCTVFVKQEMPSGAVNLGLSVNWASCNVGASSPEEFGGYYAWGETTVKSDYSWSNYKYGTSTTTLTKYNTNSSNGTVDNLTVLQMSDDAAKAKLGGKWRMPTDAECTELRENCTWIGVNFNGVNGSLVYSNVEEYADNCIFLPYAGSWSGTTLSGAATYGRYWSSSLSTDTPSKAWDIHFHWSKINQDQFGRSLGRSVRPVYGEISVSSVTITPSTLSLFIGKTSTLTANVRPSNATDNSVTWSSSNTAVATVNSSGKVTAVAAGTATITATANDGSGKKATCAVTVKAPVDLSSSCTANCYIVSQAGTYKFKTVKGNSSTSVGTVSSVAVLWESFGTATAPSKGAIIASVSYSSNYITFSTPSTLKNGNAVIAAKNSNGTIIWSWHIWVCSGYDPLSKAQTYKNSAGKMMDRNLGATSATPGDVGAFGLSYQWGRKDPFLDRGSLSSITQAASTLSWPNAVASNSSNGTITYSVAHPTTFITYGDNYNGDWHYSGDSSSADNTRWQSNKTIYDPCPAGWRVPEGDVWAKASNHTESTYITVSYDSTKKGTNLTGVLSSASIVWYPYSANKYENDGRLGGRGGGSEWWSCTPDYVNARTFRILSSNRVYTYAVAARAAGLSVRCIKE